MDVAKIVDPIVAVINAQEPETQAMSDDALKAEFLKLKDEVQGRLKDADAAEAGYREILHAALEPAIVPAFALAREAGRRFLNMRRFDVQLIGGLVLHDGKIAEM